MARTNEQIAEDKIAGTLTLDIGGQATARKLFDFGYSLTIAADGAANTAISATQYWSNPFDFPVLASFEVNPGAAVVADATNFGTLSITVDDGLAGTAVAAATFITNATNWASKIDLAPATTNVANCVVPANANIFYTQTKSGGGVAFPSRALKARFRRL